jgi:hypothetical protein
VPAFAVERGPVERRRVDRERRHGRPLDAAIAASATCDDTRAETRPTGRRSPRDARAMAGNHDRHVDPGARERRRQRRDDVAEAAGLRVRRGFGGDVDDAERTRHALLRVAQEARGVLRRKRVHGEAAASGWKPETAAAGVTSTCQWYDAACSSPTGALWSTNAIGRPAAGARSAARAS